MQLPVMPPVSPMLSKAAAQIPLGEGMIYEPKWDGFRCILFRDGDEVALGSRNERPLTRYFPEVVEVVRRHLPARCVLDGELVIAGPAGLDFELLSQRIHPADSRVRHLAATTPASFVAFDLLAVDDEDLRGRPFAERRRLLEASLGPAEAMGRLADGERGGGERFPAGLRLTPMTTDVGVATDWFSRFEGAGLDGVVAKRADLAYLEGQRVMVKVKHERTGDFVVGGFRWYKGGDGVGSLLLGLYDDAGGLAHVGVIGSFALAQRRSLLEHLAPYRELDAESPHPWLGWATAIDEGPQRGRGAGNRWNAGKDMSFEALRPELVVEAAYEHLQGARLRHTARFRRWRPDRQASSCTYGQLEVAVPAELTDVFSAG